MRIAFFGLSFHERTGSYRFLLDLLRQHAEVTAWFAEPDIADVRQRCVGFDETGFDAIVIFQLHHAFVLMSGRHPNVTFVPMYDAMFRKGAFAWRPSFSAAKVLCFSWALRQEVMRRAPIHAHVQYYPRLPERPATDFVGLRGFFWYRRRDLGPERIFALTAGNRFDSLTIHDAPDPGNAAQMEWPVPAHVGRLVRTEWSADGQDFAQALSTANVFFAPRLAEGIGMSFLEAMAAGLCVVAYDAPTMNEVISHGANGLLYTAGRRTGLDFSKAQEIGARAREDVAFGRARWEAGIPRLLDFVATPTGALRARGEAFLLTLAAPNPTLSIGRGAAVTIISREPVATNADRQQAFMVEHITPGPNETWTELVGRCHTEWLLVLPPGDRLTCEGGLAALAAAAQSEPEAAAICGHALVAAADGSEEMRRADALGAAWRRFLEGEVRIDGPAGMPMPAASLVRRRLLARLASALPETAPALAAILLAAQEEGRPVVICDTVVARCAHRPTSVMGLERRAWLDLVRQREGEPAMDACAVAIATRAQTARARHRATCIARVALGLIEALDLLASPLGWEAERLLLRGAEWIRAIRRSPHTGGSG